MKALLCISTLVLTAIHQASAAEKGIADYFRELPPNLLESQSPSGDLDQIRRGDSTNSFIDSHNGFMFVEAQEAQVSMQIALFRYADQRPLLAIAWGGYMGPDYTTVSFFTERNGRMIPVSRAILPVGDSDDLRFELPRIGLTLVIRDSGGRVVSKWTWNRTRFTED
jgi:hypothetical protein